MKLARVDYRHPEAVDKLSRSIFNYLNSNVIDDLVIVGVGSDRSTGDSLGPLVGTFLTAKNIDVPVYGTIYEPVHALNLEETMNEIYSKFDNPHVLAIDACLGNEKYVGQISFGKGPLYPGLVVGKKLPPVGDVHIKGVVNVGGFMEYFVMQNTRLSVVMNMAFVIAKSIQNAVMTWKEKSKEERESDITIWELYEVI